MIKVRNLTKIYKVYTRRTDRLKEWLRPGHRKYHREYVAVDNVSFEVPSGCVYGIIGMNGAGKSTLLKILTGTTKATRGTIEMSGRIAALLELGTGFHPELSGRENILINGRLAGLTDTEIQEKITEIKDFSELGDFFDQPIRTYSSGMYVRLAFSLASSIDPDILIIDEALSVGDAYFQQKCLKKIRSFKEKGVTILFVSHDASAIKMLCDHVALMDRGTLISTGDPQDMLEQYNALLARVEGHGREYVIEKPQSIDSLSGSLVSGNSKAVIQSVRILDDHQNSVTALVTGSSAKIAIDVAFNSEIEAPTVGFMIRDRLGYDIFGTNTLELGIQTGLFRAGQAARFEFAMPFDIGAGEFTITAAVHASRTHIEECFQWVDRILTFKMLPTHEFHFLGVNYLKPTVRIESLSH